MYIHIYIDVYVQLLVEEQEKYVQILVSSYSMLMPCPPPGPSDGLRPYGGGGSCQKTMWRLRMFAHIYACILKYVYIYIYIYAQVWFSCTWATFGRPFGLHRCSSAAFGSPPGLHMCGSATFGSPFGLHRCRSITFGE